MITFRLKKQGEETKNASPFRILDWSEEKWDLSFEMVIGI